MTTRSQMLETSTGIGSATTPLLVIAQPLTVTQPVAQPPIPPLILSHLAMLQSLAPLTLKL